MTKKYREFLEAQFPEENSMITIDTDFELNNPEDFQYEDPYDKVFVVSINHPEKKAYELLTALVSTNRCYAVGQMFATARFWCQRGKYYE